MAGSPTGVIGGAEATELLETGGPTVLTMAAVADGTVLYRTGTTIAGATLSGLTITAGVLTNDLISGKATGQTIKGGTAAGEALTLVGSAHASGGIVNIAASMTIASAASATWNAIVLGSTSTATLSGSTNITTSAGFNMLSIPAPTITSGSALTVTSAATMTILGAPAAGGSTTITNAYALWVQAGATRIDGNIGVGILPVNAIDVSSAAPTIKARATNSSNAARIWASNSAGTDFSMYCYGSGTGGSTIGVANAALALFYTDTANMAIGSSHASAAVYLSTVATVRLKIDSTGLWTLFDGTTINTGTTTGVKLGTGTTQKLGFWNATAVVQPASTGTTTTGFTANASANAVFAESTFTGNTGSTAYTVSDIVKNLKTCGILAS